MGEPSFVALVAAEIGVEAGKRVSISTQTFMMTVAVSDLGNRSDAAESPTNWSSSQARIFDRSKATGTAAASDPSRDVTP